MMCQSLFAVVGAVYIHEVSITIVIIIILIITINMVVIVMIVIIIIICNSKLLFVSSFVNW